MVSVRKSSIPHAKACSSKVAKYILHKIGANPTALIESNGVTGINVTNEKQIRPLQLTKYGNYTNA